MNDIKELVDLPDPAEQPLVHPLDLPEARRPLRAAWLISALTSPPVGLCVAVIVWFASTNVVVPLIAGAAIIVCGALAGLYYRGEAWAHIPRKRQDRQRALPLVWEVTSALVFGVVLAVALGLVALRITQPDVPTEVAEYTIGMAGAVALLVVAEFVGGLLRGDGGRRRAMRTLPGVLAVAGSVAGGYFLVVGTAGPALPATMVWGAATMLAISAAVALGKRVWERRAAREARA